MAKQSVKENNLMQLGYIFLFSRIFVNFIYNPMARLLQQNNILSKAITKDDIAFYASIFGILFLFLIFPFKEKFFGKTNIKNIKIWPLIFASIFGGALYLYFYNGALGKLGVGKASVTYYVYPVFLYIVGSILIDKDIKKAFNPKILIGIATCLFGVFCTYYEQIMKPTTTDVLGYVFIISSAICMIIFSLIVKKYKVPTYWFLLVGQTISIFIPFIKGITNHEIFKPTSINVYVTIIMLLFGIFANCLREFFRIKSVEYLPISKISTWNYFSPIMAGLSGVVFLGEKMTIYDYLGYVFVIGGNVIANYKKKK
ncbi:MAG: DMT family transporter [Clostridiales bacterium]|jgi:drug/metabolite transporter (DMT)-like permease|nr:DMT family transporter [Clostridiales bacterium]